jgi:hypothetical protein
VPRESQLNEDVNVNHIAGKLNPSDLLTKEHKTGETFIQLFNLVVPLRSDGGCWNLESRIQSRETKESADMKETTEELQEKDRNAE